MNDSSTSEIQLFIEKQDSFFKSISTGSRDEVEKFMKTNRWLRVGYNTSNNSALSAALKARQFQMYAMLIAYGFSAGIDKEVSKLLKQLSEEHMIEIRNENKKYFKSSPDFHILHLLAKTKLGPKFDDRGKCFEVIRSMYEAISEVPSGRVLLKFIENVERLGIVFDFSREHVQDLEPTASQRTQGLTFHHSGYILIGAKDHEKEEMFTIVIGVLGHEFVHYIMQLLHENDSNPYRADDAVTETAFKAIVKDIDKFQRSKFLNNILKSVFFYHPEHWTIEMIVRVVQLRLTNKNHPNQLCKLMEIECVKDLFDFYDEVTEPYIIRQTKSIKHTLAVKEINRIARVLEKIKKLKVEIEESRLDILKIKEKTCNVIVSNAPKLTLINIFQLLKRKYDHEINFSDIFIHEEVLEIGEMVLKIDKARELDVDKFLVVDISKKLLTSEYLHELETCVGSLKNTVLVTETASEIETLNTIRVEHFWDDLTDDAKEVLMTSCATFQGVSMPLALLLDGNRAICKDLKLNELIEGTLVISQKMQSSNTNDEEKQLNILVADPFVVWDESRPETFINFHRNFTTFIETVEELIEYADKHKVMTIYDEELSKLFEVAEAMKLPTNWVQLVDFNRISLGSFFKKYDDFGELACEKLMEFRHDSDKRVFQYLYSLGRVVLILRLNPKVFSRTSFDAWIKNVEFNRELGNILIMSQGSE
jgi:hypothetical protein